MKLALGVLATIALIFALTAEPVLLAVAIAASLLVLALENRSRHGAGDGVGANRKHGR